uniref:Toll-like receptor 2 n=1 Tax=Andrias davidianus TaxID=141262 RepID=V5QRC8_ANDDA|nr:toll-like receptor 2 type 2 [Andrias davidianus]
MLILTWIWVLQTVITATASEHQAPAHPCSCNSEHVCDCSSMDLKNLPSGLPREVQKLNLSNNKIDHIKGTDLQAYVQLKILLLQVNEINTIDDNSFHSLSNLEHLDLSHNKLTSLQFSWFRHLVSLKFLNLLGNYYTTLGTNRLFANLTGLRYLKFGNPDFSAVKNHNFEGITDLDELEVDIINLNQYQVGSFTPITNINHMIVNVKQDLLFRILGDILNSVTWLEVRNADFRRPESVVGMDLLVHSVVKKLTFRNISMTDESTSTLIEIMSTYRHVLELDVEECTLYGTGRGHPVLGDGPKSIRIVTIKSVKIPNFFLFSNLEFVYDFVVNLTAVTCVDTKVFLVPCKVAKSFISLEYLDLSGNLLSDDTLRFSTCYSEGGGAWPLLRTLNMSGNYLQQLDSVAQSLSNQEHLINLDISQNSFMKQLPQFCQWPKTLKYLNISSSHIKILTTCIPTTLEVLDVSNNALSQFVVRLPLLKELYITKNKLVSLPSADYLPNLIILTIRTNSLNSFYKKDLETLKKLRVLDAGDNNYICSCEFLAFIHSQKGISDMLIGWPMDYVCDSPSSLRGIQVKEAELSVIVCHKTLFVSSLCSVVVLVLIICVALCYKYHAVWYAKMIWAWLKAKRQPRRILKEDICYDAFVSYSERDSEWVENIMGQELENAHPPLKLCLHKRDFVPGKWIIDNIIDSMERSHKTLFVLSEYFVQSEWCKYELEFSHFRLFDENNDAAILILLEPIAKKTIPKRFCKLRKLMNTKTYLEWPLEEAQQQIFWFNLRTALQTKDYAAKS